MKKSKEEIIKYYNNQAKTQTIVNSFLILPMGIVSLLCSVFLMLSNLIYESLACAIFFLITIFFYKKIKGSIEPYKNYMIDLHIRKIDIIKELKEELAKNE